MRLPRLKPYVTAIIGSVLTLGAGAYIYFEMITPTDDKIKAAQAKYDLNFPDSTLQKQSEAKKLVKAATLLVAQMQTQWDQKQHALMPPIDLTDRDKAWRQETLELTKNLGEDVLRWVPRTGVTMTNAISLPTPPIGPNALTNAPLIINLGGFNVIGDFRKILSHVVKWNNFDRLVLIDQLALHGNSPNMRGNYTATVFIFPQNGDKMGPLIPKAGGAGGAGPGGGGGRPPPGFGFPG